MENAGEKLARGGSHSGRGYLAASGSELERGGAYGAAGQGTDQAGMNLKTGGGGLKSQRT